MSALPDLAIIGTTALPLSLLAAMEHDFTESDLPFKVDLMGGATTSEASVNVKVVVK